MKIDTVLMMAQLESLGGKAGGLLAQALTMLLGVAVAWVSVIVIWNLLVSMFKNPDFGKLLGIVAIGAFGVFLVGAAPDALDAAYVYGTEFFGGGE